MRTVPAARARSPRVLVVVPTYNEAATLERVVEATLAARADLDVLVVDDGSPDGTGALADRLARSQPRVSVLHRERKAGLGPAYLAGFGWGLARGYDALCEMDADLSHDPADLDRLVQALAGGDVAIGSRYVPGGAVVDWAPGRLRLSQAGNRYVRTMTGLPVADATSGFRAYRRCVLEALELHSVASDGYAFQLEMALRAWRAGFRLVELPITFTERREGASKISRAIVAEAIWRTAWWGLAGPRGPRAVHPASVAAAPMAPAG
jgi:glycosyltransferase involved in cell wall biosynthesis